VKRLGKLETQGHIAQWFVLLDFVESDVVAADEREGQSVAVVMDYFLGTCRAIHTSTYETYKPVLKAIISNRLRPKGVVWVQIRTRK
jgi:hypothetical protein